MNIMQVRDRILCVSLTTFIHVHIVIFIKDCNLLFFFTSAFAFAELIDNSLAATATNEGIRKVEIRLVSVFAEIFSYFMNLCMKE